MAMPEPEPSARISDPDSAASVAPEQSRAAHSAPDMMQAVEPEAPVAPAPQPAVRQMFRALRHPTYRMFWTGNFLSNIGTWMQNLAQGWLVLQLTNSPLLLGLVGFTSWIPVLVFTLVGGVIADLADRRRMMILAQSTLMVLAFSMALLTSLGIISVVQVLWLSFFSGLATALNAPAYQASVPELVPQEDLTNAIAMNSAQFNMSRVIGPALAGWAMVWVGLAGCFYLNAASFLALLFVLARIRFPRRAETHGGGYRIWEPLRAAFVYIHHRPVLGTLMLLVALASVCGMPYAVLMPIFARDILGVGPHGLGYLMSASGLGALSGALLLAWRGDRPRKGAFALRAALIFYLSLVLFSLSRRFELSLLALAFTGGAMVSAVATVNNLLQKHVAPQMRGRIMAMHAMAFMGFAPIGSLVAGALAELVGAPVALASLCILALGITAAVRFRQAELCELA